MVNELTEKDKIEHFKRECKSMRYYRGMLRETEDKLEEIAVKLAGVSSPAFKEVVLENAGSGCNRESKILALIVEEENLCKEREYWKEQIRNVVRMLNRIEDPTDRMLIQDLFVDRKITFREAAKMYNYSRSNLHRKVNEAIKNAIC